MNCLSVYAAAIGLAPPFFSALGPGLPRHRVAHNGLVSSRMKTDVVLPACHKPPNQLTCVVTQTDLAPR